MRWVSTKNRSRIPTWYPYFPSDKKGSTTSRRTFSSLSQPRYPSSRLDTTTLSPSSCVLLSSHVSMHFLTAVLPLSPAPSLPRSFPPRAPLDGSLFPQSTPSTRTYAIPSSDIPRVRHIPYSPPLLLLSPRHTPLPLPLPPLHPPRDPFPGPLRPKYPTQPVQYLIIYADTRQR